MSNPANPMSVPVPDQSEILALLHAHISSTLTIPSTPPPAMPTAPALSAAKASITTLPATGLGAKKTLTHLLTDVLPGLPAQSTSPHYYGFVTGGTTPAALAADILVTLADQNVQVHLPHESVSTDLESAALSMLLQLFRLDTTEWRGRTLTTGATASNILGLACAREHLLREKLILAGYSPAEASVGEMGVLGACVEAGIMGIQILSAAAHSSVAKAASTVGIGRRNIHDLSRPDAPWEFGLEELERRLEAGSQRGVVSIVVVGFGEVNTGMFITNIREVRALVTKYGAWLHIDAAFGIFARVLAGAEGAMGDVGSWADGLELADSITGDGHKLLNVPYDCGFFFTRDPALLTSTFLNAAPYLSSPPISTPAAIPSPLNIGLENSRRFRALPVYATLHAYGSTGYKILVTRLVTHARGIARFIYRHPAYELLPAGAGGEEEAVGRVFVVVLFRAREERVNKRLKERINSDGRMYVSGTMWEGREAVRCAVGNWRVCTEGWGLVEEVLEGVIKNAEEEGEGEGEE
ncbi:PLP-dependent transferase [Morchella conica CCBAS932]|uniref:PLP-dependent transferase n=1 Tax=Morchella conica CCBAS932 TaxID=1392247 RepID=A0A3N4KK11_9PEZI|nr:PLP-dependent transferase [Morchella conica CCBAS932]